MSARTRIIFALIVAAFGAYQIANDNLVAGLIGIGLAGALFFVGRKT